MRATSEAVEGDKVRLSVDVDEPEVDQVLDAAIRTMSRQARVPGFRPGKVPRQVLEARMGGAVALRAEALREAIPEFYGQALAEAEVDPITAPHIDITSGEERGALSFDALVQVRPVVGIPGYAGLRVTVPSPEVTDADVDAQIDRMRDTEAELIEVGRPAADRDYVTIDLHGTAPSGEEVISYDDLLYEVGSGGIVPELDQQLAGAKIGYALAFSAKSTGTEPDASGEIKFVVLVKDVKEKKLPSVTDEWAAESSEFATVAALRDDLRERMGRVKVMQAQLSLRQGAMSALAELVDQSEVPDSLVEEELRERASDFARRLGEQGVSVAQLLQATGRGEEDLVAELRNEARQVVTGDLALRALASAESLDVTPAEVDAEIESMAARLDLAPAVVRERLTRAGRIAAVRSEQRKAKALTWLLDHVELVDEEGAPVSRDVLQEDQGAGEESTGSGAEGDVGTGVGDEGSAEHVVAAASVTGDTKGKAES